MALMQCANSFTLGYPLSIRRTVNSHWVAPIFCRMLLDRHHNNKIALCLIETDRPTGRLLSQEFNSLPVNIRKSTQVSSDWRWLGLCYYDTEEDSWWKMPGREKEEFNAEKCDWRRRQQEEGTFSGRINLPGLCFVLIWWILANVRYDLSKHEIMNMSVRRLGWLLSEMMAGVWDV